MMNKQELCRFGIRRTRVPQEPLEFISHVSRTRKQFYEQVIAEAERAKAIFKSHNLQFADYFMGLGLMGSDMNADRILSQLEHILRHSTTQYQKPVKIIYMIC